MSDVTASAAPARKSPAATRLGKSAGPGWPSGSSGKPLAWNQTKAASAMKASPTATCFTVAAGWVSGDQPGGAQQLAVLAVLLGEERGDSVGVHEFQVEPGLGHGIQVRGRR